jgi:hypothetical protein
MTIKLPIHNIKIFDFSAIFKNNIEADLLNDLHEYKLIKNDKFSIKNKDVKKLIYHHVIYGLCEHVLSLRCKERVLVYYCTSIVPGKHIRKFTEYEPLQIFMNKLILKLIKILPIKFMYETITFNILKNDIKHQGEYAELTYAAKQIVEKFDISKYSFNKLRYFTKKYDLKFLSTNYFKKVKNKQLILS